MGCAFCWHEIVFEYEFGPASCREIEKEGFVGDDEFALVREVIPAMRTAPPKSTALVCETMVKV